MVFLDSFHRVLSLLFSFTVCVSLLESSCGVNVVSNLCGQVHAFYYLWYGTPNIDEDWKHWNHKVLPHWRPEVNQKFSQIGVPFNPPESLHSPQTPLLGPYSSRNVSVIRSHLLSASTVGIDVLVASWWGQEDSNLTSDSQGVNTDSTLRLLIQTADDLCLELGNCPVRIAFHLEPYSTRNSISIASDVDYLVSNYASSPSVLMVDNNGMNLMVFYVYDSYHISSSDWQSYFTRRNKIGLFFGLILNKNDVETLIDSGFDGGYTYFASDGFSFGSSRKNWQSICKTAKQKSSNFICNISIGPGYNDTKIRPWNDMNTKPRGHFTYYQSSWESAIKSNPCIISITSFNEWGEGTQIEASVEDGGGYLNETRRNKILFSKAN